MEFFEIILLFTAAVAAGFVNAVAGGGTLITFPSLVGVGFSEVVANITNTIALSPGYFAGTYGQKNEIKKQRKKLIFLIITGITGGITGGLILLNSNEKSFKIMVPFLILFASLLFAFQDKIKKRITKTGKQKSNALTGFFLLFSTCVYGGYFGAGLGILLLVTLSFLYSDQLSEINALKQFTSFMVNLSTAIFFIIMHNNNWIVISIMAIGAIAGGYSGGKLASRLNPVYLKRFIVFCGIVISVYFFTRILVTNP